MKVFFVLMMCVLSGTILSGTFFVEGRVDGMEQFGVAEGRGVRKNLTVTKGMKGAFGKTVLDMLNGPGLPAVVTEQHHEVLRYWMAMSNEGHFDGGVPPEWPNGKRKKVTVFHFDSHPDMAFPGYFKRRWPKSVNWLHKSGRIQINSFIPAAIWMGLVDRVVWVRPEWSHQFAKDNLEDLTLRMGKLTRGKESLLRVNSLEDYWLDYEAGKGHWKHPNFTKGVGYFEDSVEFKFRVVPLNKLNDIQLPEDTQVVIDIDEDFFATENPSWKNLVAEHGLEKAKECADIFDRSKMCLDDDLNVRVWQHYRTAHMMMDMVRHRWYKKSKTYFLEKFKPLREMFCKNKTTVLRLRELMLNVGSREKMADMMENAQPASLLPTEIPGKKTILGMLDEMNRFFKSFESNIKLITICRSVVDDFTPLNAWPFIEFELKEMLHKAFHSVNVVYDRKLKPARQPMADSSLGDEFDEFNDFMVREYYGEHFS